MDFSFGSELESIRAEAAKLAGSFDDAYWSRHDEKHEFPWDFYNAFAEQGWIGIAVPEAYGGAGLGSLHAGVLLGAVAQSAGTQNAASALHLSIFGMGPVIHHGSEELKRRTLPPTATGELHVSFGVTEDDAGTDTSRIRTTAVRDGDSYVINGQKVWTSRIEHSDLMLLLARTTPKDQVAHRTEGLSVFLVDMREAKGAGLEIRPIRTMINHATCELFFDNLHVPAANLIGEEGKGFSYILDGMNAERILIASECIGDGRWFIDRAVAYAGERRVFDRPIGQNQGVQFPIARAYANVRAAALMVEAAAQTFDAGENCGEEANMAKLLASEAAWEAGDTCMQTFGGYGFAEEMDVERKFRETRLYRTAPVSTNMILAYIAEHVLGLPRSY